MQAAIRNRWIDSDLKRQNIDAPQEGGWERREAKRRRDIDTINLTDANESIATIRQISCRTAVKVVGTLRVPSAAMAIWESLVRPRTARGECLLAVAKCCSTVRDGLVLFFPIVSNLCHFRPMRDHDPTILLPPVRPLEIGRRSRLRLWLPAALGLLGFAALPLDLPLARWFAAGHCPRELGRLLGSGGSLCPRLRRGGDLADRAGVGLAPPGIVSAGLGHRRGGRAPRQSAEDVRRPNSAAGLFARRKRLGNVRTLAAAESRCERLRELSVGPHGRGRRHFRRH